MQVINIWKRLARSIKYIWKHPLVKDERLSAFVRYFYFHLSTRIKNQERIIPFIQNTKINLCRDLEGTATNYFTYLSDFNEMMFLLHILNPNDVFVDIGSNVGVWTLLASGVVGCKTIALEPAPETYKKLESHIILNDIGGKVNCSNIAVGAKDGFINISNGRGALNRVLLKDEKGIQVIQKPLDSIVDNLIPSLIKIDVEGFENEVIKGGKEILLNPKLEGIIIELNGSSIKYGSSNDEIHSKICEFGFHPIKYDPFKRDIIMLNQYNLQSHNTIYIREINKIKKLLIDAPNYQIGKFIL